MIKGLFKKLLDLWDIYGGVITSIAIALIVGFEKKIMDKVTSFTSMTLVITSVFVSLKVYYRRERKNILDAFVLSESPISAINPIGKSKAITSNITKIKEKNKMDIKKKIYTLFNNKWTIISLIWDSIIVVGLTAMSITGKFNDVLPNIPEHIKIWLSIGISILFLAPCVYTQVTKYGLESYAEIVNRKKEKLLKKSDINIQEKIGKAEEAFENVKEEIEDESSEEKSPIEVVKITLSNAIDDASERVIKSKTELELISKEIVEVELMKNLLGYIPDVYNEKYKKNIAEKVKLEAIIQNDTKFIDETKDKLEQLNALNLQI